MINSHPHYFDVVISGAGWIGCSLACMLADEGFNVALVEQHDLTVSLIQDDSRSIVLSFSSYQILQALGIWSQLEEYATPISHVHVSQRGHFGSAQFSATDLKLPVLGYVVPAYAILKILRNAMQQRKNVTILAPAEIDAILSANEVTLLQNGEKYTVKTPLLVAAEGSHSKIRKMLAINTRHYDYQQTAIATQVDIGQASTFTAYERLTPHGPLALLPRGQQRYGVAWTVATAQAQELMESPADIFLNKLQQAFGFRLGKFSNLSKRSSFSLQLLQAENFFQPGVILLGNAAHTLHPIAGQGFNLGLRDAAALAEIIYTARAQQENWGDIKWLQRYWDWREQDQRQIIRFTDRTVRLLANEYLSFFASIGLLTLNLFPRLQRRLVKQLLGLTGKTPRLACGVALNTINTL